MEKDMANTILGVSRQYVDEIIDDSEIKQAVITYMSFYISHKNNNYNYIKIPFSIIKSLRTNAIDNANVNLLLSICFVIEIGVVILDDIQDSALPVEFEHYDKNELMLLSVLMITNLPTYLIQQMTLSSEDKLRFCEVVAKCELEMAIGQIKDLASRRTKNLSIDESLSIIKKKTGVWRGLYAQLAAITVNADDANVKRIYDFGVSIGVIKQIYNDLSDIFQDFELVGRDLKNGTKSFPLTVFYEKADNETKVWFDNSLKNFAKQPSFLTELQEKVADPNILGYIVDTMRKYEQRAINCLLEVNDKIDAAALIREFGIDLTVFYRE